MLSFLGKRTQAVVLVLVIAFAATAGLLWLMQGLAASRSNSQSLNPAPTAVAVNQAAALPLSRNPIEVTPLAPDSTAVVAVINSVKISQRTWQQATWLDGVMSQLAGQPVPSAEETLDRLINEVLVLAAAPNAPPPAPAEVESRLAGFEAEWRVSEAGLVTALARAGLTRTDLTDRLSRLIQVETALQQLAAREGDLDAWLQQARAAAAIALYTSLASPPPTLPGPSPRPTEAAAALPTSVPPTPEPAAPPLALPAGPYPGQAAPDFSLARLNSSETLALASLRGRPVLVNFWASWCPPCRSELPALQAAYQRYGEQIGFVAVNVKEDPGTVATLVKELGLTFPVALDQDGLVSDLGYEIRGLPTTVFIDAAGIVTARHVGPLDGAAIDGYLEPLLSPPPASPEAALLPAPDFSLTAADGRTISLADYRDKTRLVLVFYRGQT